MYVLEAVEFFVPYVLSALALASVFGLAMNRKFVSKDQTGRQEALFAFSRATTFFFMFSAFGVVIAYFLSLGIKEVDGNWVNPLVDGFATPLVALLTAGVSYFTKQQAPNGALTVVPAGVICFLIESVICYRGLFLQLVGDL